MNQVIFELLMLNSHKLFLKIKLFYLHFYSVLKNREMKGKNYITKTRF